MCIEWGFTSGWLRLPPDESTVATGIRAIQAIEIRLKNDLNGDRFL